MVGLEGKVIAIIGASSGIGEGIAKTVASQNPKGLIIGARREEFLNNLATQLRDQHDTDVFVLPTNATDQGQLKSFVDKSIKKYGKIDILIYSAGIIQKEMPAHQVTPEERRRIMEINYHAPAALSALILPHFYENKSGTYIVLSSQAGQPDKAFPGEGAYGASKSAIDQDLRSIDREIHARREEGSEIYVFALAPGLINTEEAKMQLPNIPKEVWEKAPSPKKFASEFVIPYLTNPSDMYKKGKILELPFRDTTHFIDTARG